jgi:hypothetical protein
MITATPDDYDVDKFKKAAGIDHLHRIRFSRKEAVYDGLIKDGIKSNACLAADDQNELVGFAATALADEWGMHNVIRQSLQTAWLGAIDADAGRWRALCDGEVFRENRPQ